MYHPSFNIGIEEEYQIIDPDSRELLGYVTQSMVNEQMVVRERSPDADLAQRFSEAVIQVGTPVCADIKEAREQLVRMRASVLALVHASGAKVLGAGTHPFSHWENRSTILPGYRALIDDAQMIARRLLCFGLRVHIGVEDRELAVDVMNTMRYVLPHILCLANSSPFWVGRNTGLKSYRNVLLDALPRTGIPGYFSSYQEYRSYIDTLIRTNSIPDASQVRYDIMPHYRFPTLVIRICDMLPNVHDVLAVTALIQASVAWMVDLRQRNLQFRLYERLLIAENKWRAVRYGLDNKLLDLGVEQAIPTVDLIRELLERVAPYTRKLNSADELAYVETIITRGASADQQLQVWKAHSQDAKAVVDFLVTETEKIE
ncbi:MAG: carboxylate-amine ligase [Caldilineaceae bacterium]|nr:carboxylate-amine ligase [Caldilineaceae bacterium]